MSFLRLFWRDCVYYRKTFAAISVTAGLVCAVLTAAMLIGDSVRGTLYDNLNRNTAFAKTLLRFSVPVEANMPGAVLHTNGFISPGIQTHLYAFADSSAIPSVATSRIQGRDAYCSSALAETLNLKNGDLLTVRVQTIASISSESLMGQPPKLKQIPLIYRGVWPDEKADVNFESPQLRENNLFVNHAFLAESLGLKKNVVNEVWSPIDKVPALSDEVIWQLSQLDFERWDDRPVLKSKAFFLPEQMPQLFPEAVKGLTTFAESFSGTSPDDETKLNYFFVGAFDGDVFPVEKDHAVLADSLEENFPHGGTLTYFSSDGFRAIRRQTHQFPHVLKASDSHINAVLTPEIPGLTDMSECSEWDTGLPIDLEKIQGTDIAYWEQHKSKPKLYLNFTQAQQLFSPGQCNILIFDRNADTAQIQKKIVTALRKDSLLYQTNNVIDSLRANVANGIHFTPLFLGLSFFIMIAALLVLMMLLKLHLFDRAEEFRVLAGYTSCKNKMTWFHATEIILILLPGMGIGLLVGTLLCRLQLLLLERIWNGIILMNRLNFHAHGTTFLIAFVATLLCSVLVLICSLRSGQSTNRYYGKHSRPIRSVFALGTRSFFRRWGQYRLCMILLIMGFLGTLGVGAFGIKSRGEDAFSYAYIAEKTLPVLPSHDEPFPPGGFAVHVKSYDNADCSNILQAETPTVYGCDVSQLTGDSHFLHGRSAAADKGSLQWIMKKRIGDEIRYPNGSVTLERAMKASVFQRGILIDNATFEKLFPEVQGARFFLIRNQKSAEDYRKFLEPYGVTLSTVDAFMAKAESFQNRYLVIFLQLGTLGFLLGIGSLLLLMLRSFHARRNEIRFLSDVGFSDKTLFLSHFIENLWLYLASAVVSLFILCVLALVAQIHLSVLLAGWFFLAITGVALIFITLRIVFYSDSTCCESYNEKTPI